VNKNHMRWYTAIASSGSGPPLKWAATAGGIGINIPLVDMTPSSSRSSSSSSSSSSRQPQTVEKLHVQTYGEGDEHVVLIHGLGGTHADWHPLLREMNTRKYRYVCPDLLGHGRSSKPLTVAYTPETHLSFLDRDVISCIGDDIRQPKAFHLIGHGVGSVLALELASRHVHRVLSITLIALPYYDNEAQAAELLLPEILRDGLLSRWSTSLFSKNADLLRPLLELTRPMNLVLDSTQTAEQIYGYASTFEECVLRHRVDKAATTLLRSATIWIDLIHGRNDRVVPLSRSQAFFSKYGQICQFDVVDDCGHDVIRTAPVQLARHITSCLG
jgi:pimeloyl-ACP methyl ester carboxylesterase